MVCLTVALACGRVAHSATDKQSDRKRSREGNKEAAWFSFSVKNTVAQIESKRGLVLVNHKPYHYMPCGRPSLDQPYSWCRYGHPQGVINTY
jgi:hypothetical protein